MSISRPITEANRLFKMLFASETKQQREGYRKAIKENASVLDAVFQQAKNLKGDLGREDQRKIDEYLNSVRSVEKALANADQWINQPKPKVEFEEPQEGGPFTQRLPLFYDLNRVGVTDRFDSCCNLEYPRQPSRQ